MSVAIFSTQKSKGKRFALENQNISLPFEFHKLLIFSLILGLSKYWIYGIYTNIEYNLFFQLCVS